MLRNQSVLLTSTALVSTALTISTALAQSSQGDSAQDLAVLEEILVTAQKRSENLNEVPLSITAVTGERLANLGITDPSQLVGLVPGFTYQLSQYGTPVFGIRGINFFDTTGSATPAVSIYMDEVPLPLSIITRGAAFDLERVEVLKGPQGTLFGENSTGGAINYIAAKPTEDLTASAQFTYGRFGQVEVGGHVSSALSDTVAFRLSARTEQRNEWQYSTTRDDENGDRSFSAARLLLDWTPSSTLKLSLNVNAWIDKSDTQAAQFQRFEPTLLPPMGFQGAIDAFTAYASVPGNIANNNAREADWDPEFSLQRDDRFVQASLRADWDLGEETTITSITSYSDYEGFAPTDVDGTDFAGITNTLVKDFEIFSQELRVASVIGPVNTLLGANYSYQSLDETGVNFLNGTNTIFPTGRAQFQDAINNQEVSTFAFFGGFDWELISNVTLRASARYTSQDRDFAGCSADGGDGGFATAFNFFGVLGPLMQPGDIQPGGCITLNPQTFLPTGLLEQPLDDDNVSWRVALDWQASDDILLYANVTKGFKFGGFATIPIGFSNQVTSVEQESVQAYEIGAKATIFEGRVQATAALFRYDYNNKQIAGSVLVPPFGTLPALVNVPESRINGAEISILAQPTSQLRLSFSTSYIDGEVTEDFITTDPFGGDVNVGGARLPTAPKWQVSAYAQYNFDLGKSWEPFFGGALNYQSDNDAIFGGGAEFVLPARTLLDLRAGIETEDGTWRFQAYARNVTNKYYWINVSNTVETIVRHAGLPATYGFTLQYNFK